MYTVSSPSFTSELLLGKLLASKIPEPFLSKLFIKVIMIQNKETNEEREGYTMGNKLML